MKVAYIAPMVTTDIDLSYLKYAQSIGDVTYFMPVFMTDHNGSAIRIKHFYPHTGIYKAVDIYPELKKWSDWVDIDKFYVINVNSQHAWNVICLWLYFKMMIKLRDFDIIHLNGNPLNFYEWFFYIHSKKILQTLHDPLPHSDRKFNTFIWRLRRKLCFRWINHFWILNSSQKQECIRINHLENKHVYDGALSRYDCIRENLNHKNITYTERHTYFLFFGGVSKYKGIDYLLEAMKRVHTQYPNMRLIVAGKGEYPFDISEYQKLDYIEFRNRFIPDDELAELIQGAYCAVCPYKDATQSGVVMSAFAFNKPIIATNVGGLPEQVEHDKYGLIVPPCDVDALANAMIHLLSHPEKLQEYADNIERDYSEGPKSWKEIAKKLNIIYQEIAEKNKQ